MEKREIKFRAWDKAKSTMLENVGFRPNDCGLSVLSSLGMIGEGLDYGTAPTLMQYTGLKDKNGKEIYEGDIVKDLTAFVPTGPAWVGYNPIHEVKYHVRDYLKRNPLYGDVGYNISSGSIYEVIGNIYENPELLNEKM